MLQFISTRILYTVCSIRKWRQSGVQPIAIIQIYIAASIYSFTFSPAYTFSTRIRFNFCPRFEHFTACRRYRRETFIRT